MVQQPPAVEKAEGQWIIPSSYNQADARSHAAQLQHGVFGFLAADIDEGNPSLDQVDAAVVAVLGDVYRLIYSTRSATANDRKWRVLVPLGPDGPRLPGHGYTACQKAFFDALEAQGLRLDRSLERVGQLIYLPNRGPFYDHRSKGQRWLYLHDDHRIMMAAVVLRHAMDESKAAQSESVRKEGPRSHLAAFRRKHSIVEMLTAVDCEESPYDPDQWRYKNQSSKGYGGIRIMDDSRWVSLSGTFNALGIGKQAASGRWGDAYDLACHLIGTQAAEECARQCLKDEDGPLIEHGRRLWEGMTHINGRRIISRDPFPVLDETLRLCGLAEELAELVYLAGDRDTRTFGTAAGLLAMSALSAPFYKLQTHEHEFVSLHLYGLVLGPTASGKEAIRTMVSKALAAAGRGEEFLDGIASMPALHDFLASPEGIKAPGAAAIAMDEQGINLKTISSLAMGHQQQLMRGLMSLFGLGFGTLASHRVRDKDKIIPSVDMPRTTLLWTSTPGKFIDAVGIEDSESGQLNRFLTFWVEEMPPKRRERAKRSLLQGLLPKSIHAECFKFKFLPNEEHQGQRGPDKVIATTAQALNLMDAFDDYVEHHHIQGKSETHAQSWGRAVEYLKKVSGLLAVSDNPTAPVCDVKHVTLARHIVEAAVSGVTTVADKSANKNARPDSWEKVLEYIEKNKDANGWVEARDVQRKALRSVEDRAGVIAQMIEAELLEEDKQEGAGRPKKMLRTTGC